MEQLIDFLYMPEFSIVMPAYNVEKYISEAIESVIHQSFQDWELIIVDDASTDNTVQIIQKYLHIDDRIKLYILPKNTGSVYIPRKEAILKSKGKMIAYLDADDYIENTFLEKIHNRYLETKADAILGRMCSIKNNLVIYTLPKTNFDMEQTISGKQACMLTVPYWNIGAAGAVNRNIYISALDKSETSNMVYADEVVTRQIMLLCRKIVFVDAKYMYRYNEESLTKKFSLKRFDCLNVNNLLLNLIEEYFGSESEEVKSMHLLLFNGVLSSIALYYTNRSKINKQEKKIIVEKLKAGYKIIRWDYIKGKISNHTYFVSHVGFNTMMFVVLVYVKAKRIKQLFKHT